MKKSKAQECVEAFRSTGTLTDVQGWYTGTDKMPKQVPQKRRETAEMKADALRPVQDADDL